jgi:general secretion pathway protein M
VSATAITLPAPLADLRRRGLQSWAALAPRDQRIARAGAVIVGLILLWALAVQPALRTLREVPPQIARLDAELQQMKALAAESKVLRAATPMPQAQAAAALKATVARLEGRVRLVQQGERATLTLSGVDGATLRALLAEVRASARARPIDAQLVRGPRGYDGTLILSLGGSA